MQFVKCRKTFEIGFHLKHSNNFFSGGGYKVFENVIKIHLVFFLYVISSAARNNR